jgi:anaerobic selenocysteine-containing dehydrogenase
LAEISLVRVRTPTTVLARDEEPYRSTQESMFSYVRLSDGGTPRHEGPRSEVGIMAELAHRVLGEGGPIDWNSMKEANEVRSWMAKLIPGMEPVGDIGSTKKEFHIPGRALYEASFPTPSGRATFHAHPLPDLTFDHSQQFKLMTVRSEGQFNTVVYEEEDLYRGQERRDVILLNAKDIERFGFRENQGVTVSSATGTLHVLVRAFDIVEHHALMYYPEANVLVDREIDPVARTPAYKSTLVTVTPAEGTFEEGKGTRVSNTAADAIRRSKSNRLKAC